MDALQAALAEVPGLGEALGEWWKLYSNNIIGGVIVAAIIAFIGFCWKSIIRLSVWVWDIFIGKNRKVEVLSSKDQDSKKTQDLQKQIDNLQRQGQKAKEHAAYERGRADMAQKNLDDYIARNRAGVAKTPEESVDREEPLPNGLDDKKIEDEELFPVNYLPPNRPSSESDYLQSIAIDEDSRILTWSAQNYLSSRSVEESESPTKKKVETSPVENKPTDAQKSTELKKNNLPEEIDHRDLQFSEISRPVNPLTPKSPYRIARYIVDRDERDAKIQF